MAETWKNYFNYFTEIEDFFVRARGKHILVSPLDWILIERWRSDGVPLAVVLRGIDRALTAHRATNPAHRLVNSLTFCHQAVMEEYDVHRLSQVGARTQTAPDRLDASEPAAPPALATAATVPPPPPAVTAALNRRAAELQQVAATTADPGVAEAATRALDHLTHLQERLAGISTSPPIETLERDLTLLDGLILPALSAALSTDERAGLRREARQALRHHRRHLPAELAGHLLDRQLEALTLRHYGITPVSLLDLLA